MNFSLTVCAFDVRMVGCFQDSFGLHTFMKNNKSFERVSDLEVCMDYFSIPGRSCERLAT